MSQAEPSPILDAYERRIAAGELSADAAQRKAAHLLDALATSLHAPLAPTSGLRRLLRRQVARPYGLYVWGDVGRGKSMLMDMFVAHIKPHCTTRRVHFHAFMLDVHKRLFAFRQLSAGDAMPKTIADIAAETQVLCLDELQVTDVTDALILARLFSGLMDAGVCVLFTSNRPPHELYQGGLQREQFMKFVALVQARMVVHALHSERDYRLVQLQAMQRMFVHPDDGAADDFMLASWQSLTANAQNEPLRIEVQGRILRVDKHVNGVAWFTFDELCARPLGANDYLTLAKLFHTVLLQHIPAMTKQERNEAKRFVTLIDTLYDQRVKLVATAAAAPDALYPSGDGSFEFHRTSSRLHEMQSGQYLALAHIP